MIKKLQRKFIMMSMLFVTIVLLAVFVTVLILNYRQAVDKTEYALDQLVESHLQPGGRGQDGVLDKGQGKQENTIDPEKKAVDGFPGEASAGEAGGRGKLDGTGENSLYALIPAFAVQFDFQGKQTGEIRQKNLELDEDQAVAIAAKALEQPEDKGVLSAYGYRYEKKKTASGGTRVGLADTAYERSAVTSMMISMAVIIPLAWLVFLLLSVGLSRVVVKPAREALTRQQQFIADSSHELKTPITIILTNMGILEKNKNATVREQQLWVENTKDEARRMKTLVENMLFLTRMDDMGQPRIRKPFSLSELVVRTALPFEAVAFERGISLDTDVEKDIGITGDEDQIRQLLEILLDNACKYAEENGSIRVRLSHIAEHIRLEVQNTGNPIPKDKLPDIFKRFYRVDSARSREAGGYGLGLAIAQNIADAHHGHLTVKSDEENGTVFRLVLPYKK